MKKKIYKEEKNENKMSYEINSFVKMVGKKYHKYQKISVFYHFRQDSIRIPK